MSWAQHYKELQWFIQQSVGYHRVDFNDRKIIKQCLDQQWDEKVNQKPQMRYYKVLFVHSKSETLYCNNQIANKCSHVSNREGQVHQTPNPSI